MVKHYYKEDFVEMPDKVKAALTDQELEISGPKGTLKREFSHPKLKLFLEKDRVGIRIEKPRKKDHGLFGTWFAHVKNMVRGVTEGFEYKMKIVYSHFPMKTTVKKDLFYIENFLGESSPRKAKIVGESKVNISGDEVTITGIDKEGVGQTAANIELATYIKGYDPRVFQDGIYIVSKGR